MGGHVTTSRAFRFSPLSLFPSYCRITADLTKTKTTVYLDEDVLRGAKVMAARTGKKDYEVVEEALRAYLVWKSSTVFGVLPI